MILFTANGRCARCLTDEKITTGSVGIEVRFDLSADFDGLAAIAVFEADGETADVILTGSSCTVPAGVLETPFVPLRIGVYARDGGGSVVIPTVWAEAGTIRPGATPGTVDPTEPVPDWTAQVQKNATDALAKSEEAMETAEEALHKTDQALTDAERYAANAKRSAEAAAESSGEASISADAAWYHRTQAEAAAAEAAGSATAAAGSATAAAGSAGEAAGSAEEAAASAAEAQRIEAALEPLDGLPERVETLEEELGFSLYPAWEQGRFTSYGYQAASNINYKRSEKLPAGTYSAAINADYTLTVVRYNSDTSGTGITKTESGGRYLFESDGQIILNTHRVDDTSIAAMTDAEINAIWQLKGKPITDRVAELEEAVDGYGAAAQPAAGTDMVATRSIAGGEYFAAGYGLYQATAAIASGETIVPGTNCTQTSSAAALNALRSGKQDQLTFDSTPTAGSSNPVTSGGVAAAVAEIDGEVSDLKSSTAHISTPTETEADLYVCDEQGNVIAEFADGHIKTKDFDSSAISVDLVQEADKTAADLYICDSFGNVVAKFRDGHIVTKYFNSADYADVLDDLAEAMSDVAALQSATSGIMYRTQSFVDGVYAACKFRTTSNHQFCLLAAGDCHSNADGPANLIKYLNEVGAVDCAVMLGDIVSNVFADSIDHYAQALLAAQKPVLTVLGNHDVRGATSDAELWSKYGALYEYADLASGEAVDGKCYYYKDFASQKMRVIVLMQYDYIYTGELCFGQAQIDWLINTLTNTPSDYAVIICEHTNPSRYMTYNMDAAYTANTWKRSNYSPTVMDGDPVPDIIDAWIKGASLTKTYAYTYDNPPSPLSVNVDFSSRGAGEFVTYLGGHWHQNVLGNVTDHTDQMDFHTQANSNASTTWSGDIARKIGTVSEDSFCAIAVDRDAKTVKVFQVGAHFTDDAIDRQYFKYSYGGIGE